MILVSGATGNVGRAVAGLLLDEGCEVRALTRRPREAELPPGAAVVAGSLSAPETLAAALDGVEKAFLVLVGDVAAQAANFAAAAQTADGLKHVVLLSSLSVVHPVRHPIGEEHRDAETAVRAIGVDWTFLRPGPFHSNALWWAPSIRADRKARCLVGNQPAAPIDPADVAAVAATALTGGGHAGATYHLTGGETLTSQQQVAIISAVTGAVIRFEVATEEEVVAVFTRVSGNGEVAAANARALRSPEVPWRTPTLAVREITGRTPRSFRDWVADHAAAFR